MAPRLRSASALHNALPEEALRAIMLALPVDARARAACVCRGWRAFLADPSLWQVLDLTPAGGVAAARVTENLVRGAVARAARQLRSLSLDGVPALGLVELIQSDGAELQQVNTDVWLSNRAMDAVFAAAPRLQVLSANVRGACAALLPFLRNDPPYGPLRVKATNCEFGVNAAVDDVLAFAAAVASHETLSAGLLIEGVAFARGTNALVDAAAERRIRWLALTDCAVDAESITALVRLFQRGSLTKLSVVCVGFPDAEESRVLELCAALRACSMLTNLDFFLNTPNGVSRRIFKALLDAAAALPALSELDLGYAALQDPAEGGRALAALLRADLPTLRTLNVTHIQFGDEGLAALLDGLAANTHLRELHCEHNFMSEAFQRDRLAPALAALAARAYIAA
jgi:hypothetical protein